jgi:hypothetical protein
MGYQALPVSGVLLHALHQFGDAGGGVNTGALGQHGCGHKVVGEQLADAKAQLVANGGPGAAHLKVANVVGHEAGARAEDGDVRAALFHQAQLVGFNGFAQLVV